MIECHKLLINKIKDSPSVSNAAVIIGSEVDRLRTNEEVNSLLEALDVIINVSNNGSTKNVARAFINSISKRMAAIYKPSDIISESTGQKVHPINIDREKLLTDRSIESKLNNTIHITNINRLHEEAISKSKQPEQSKTSLIPEEKLEEIKQARIASYNKEKTINNFKIMNNKIKAGILAEIALLSLPFGNHYLSETYATSLQELTNIIHDKGNLIIYHKEIDCLFETANDELKFNYENLNKIFIVNEEKNTVDVNPIEFSKFINSCPKLRSSIHYISENFRDSILEFLENKIEREALCEEFKESMDESNMSDNIKLKELQKNAQSPLFDKITKSVSKVVEDINEETLTVETIKYFSIYTVMKTLRIFD